jgi:isochorismate pyruvate lyase
MAELRAEIDRLDRLLVRLLSERQRYIERAAEIKHKRSDIRDEARISDVLAKVAAEAESAGLDPALAREVWQALVESSIKLELAAFDQRSR